MKLVPAGQVKGGEPVEQVFSGVDLKVGGEGMKAFYDMIVLNVVNDLLKKLGGGKIGTVQIALGEALSDEQFGEADMLVTAARGDFGTSGYKTTDGVFFDTYADAEEHQKLVGANSKPLQPQAGFAINPALGAKAQAAMVATANGSSWWRRLPAAPRTMRRATQAGAPAWPRRSGRGG